MEEKITGKRFLAVTLLNVLITIVEIIGGLISGSLALLSDAFHNMGDSFSIVLGYFAQHIGGRPETRKRTYGYRRAEILSALTNSLLLIIIAIFLIGEAIQRLDHPQHINGGIMLIVAIVGLLANLASALLLHSGSHNSLNVKATYLHVLSDAVPDFLPEELRVFLPDHKQNLLKARLQGIVDGIINNQVSPAIHRIHLL